MNVVCWGWTASVSAESPKREALCEWQAFVISLPDAVERRKSLLPELTKARIKFSVVDAIDGRAGISKADESQCSRALMMERLGRELSDTEIACALSHRKALNMILEKKLPGALVLEDDTLWSESATELLESISPGEFDFLQLDYGWADFWRFSRGKTLPQTNLSARRLARNAGLANSYVVSSSAAEFILTNSVPIHLPADWPCDLRPLNPHAIVPRVCSQSRFGKKNSFLSESRRKNKELARDRKKRTSIFKYFLPADKYSRRNPPPSMPFFLYRFLVYQSPPGSSSAD